MGVQARTRPRLVPRKARASARDWPPFGAAATVAPSSTRRRYAPLVAHGTGRAGSPSFHINDDQEHEHVQRHRAGPATSGHLRRQARDGLVLCASAARFADRRHCCYPHTQQWIRRMGRHLTDFERRPGAIALARTPGRRAAIALATKRASGAFAARVDHSSWMGGPWGGARRPQPARWSRCALDFWGRAMLHDPGCSVPARSRFRACTG
jgi:hypothetical protein